MKLTKIYIGVLILATGLLFGLIFNNQLARAEVTDWLTSPITTNLQSDKPTNIPYLSPNLHQVCTKQLIQVANHDSQDETCIYQAKSFKIGAIFRRIPAPYAGYSDLYSMVYSPNGTNQYLEVLDLGDSDRLSCWIINPNTNDLTSNCGFRVIKDLPSKLTPTTTQHNFIHPVEDALQFNNSATYTIPQHQDTTNPTSSTYANFWRTAVSNNGQWAVAEADNYAVVRVNLQTHEIKFITRVAPTGYGRDPYYEMAITNDGEYISISGLNLSAEIYKVTDICGVTAQEFDVAWVAEQSLVTNCPSRNLTQLMDEAGYQLSKPQASNFYTFTNTKFNDEGTSLTGIYSSNTIKNWLTLSLPNITTPPPPTELPANTTPHLKYLALGDSYTSGEGDTDGLTGPHHYRELTNENGPPAEKCHISTRSYPYLLAQDWKLADTDWNTVACSGALIGEDYLLNDSYLGQDGRLAKVETEDDRKKMISDSMDSFIPGRNPQLKFIKQHQPETITITGSGNDIGFSGIIQACVSPLNSEQECRYVNEYMAKYEIYKAIKDQYASIKKLVKEIKSLSPDSKIFYIGYPQFIAKTNKECGGYVSLSQKERAIFRDSVTYLNAVSREATRSEGAEYINIEDVLIVGSDNHQLCGNSKSYVNGFNLDCSPGDFISILAGKDDCAESFHPRPEAHKLIAERINKRIKDTANYCNSVCNIKNLDDIPLPQTFADLTDYSPSRMPQNGGNSIIAQKQNDALKINTKTGGLMPGTTADVILASTPTLIGKYIVNSDGTLNVSADVPSSIKPGYHTLHLEAQDKDGTLIDRWWVVRVYGPDGDINENGINDVKEACLFTPAKYTDLNSNGVDDGCDADLVANEPFKYVELKPHSNGTSLIENRITIDTSKAVSNGSLDSIISSNQSIKIGNTEGDNNQTKTQLKDGDLNSNKAFSSILILIISLILTTLVLLYSYGKKAKTIKTTKN